MQISESVPEDKVIRLLEMWDWMYTPEGWDVLCWGPESSGLRTMEGDKKVFSDPNMWELSKNLKVGEGGPEEHGLHATRFGYHGLLSRRTWTPAGANPTQGPAPAYQLQRLSAPWPDRAYRPSIDRRDTDHRLAAAALCDAVPA